MSSSKSRMIQKRKKVLHKRISALRKQRKQFNLICKTESLEVQHPNGWRISWRVK